MVNLFKFKSVENFTSETHTIAFNQVKDYGTLQIATGDTVNWTHGSNHNIDINRTSNTAANAMTRNSDFNGGTSITFNEEGHFAYQCGVHGDSMAGVIRVRNEQTGGVTTSSRQTTRGTDVTTTSRQTTRASTTRASTTRAPTRRAPSTTRAPTTAAPPTPGDPAGLGTGMTVAIIILTILGVALLAYFYKKKARNISFMLRQANKKVNSKYFY